MEDHKNSDIPKHIVDVSKQDKRRQRRTFRQVISRAGFPNARDSLSCIEPIDKAKVATSEDNQKPTDYRLSHRESQSANANSKDNSWVPYLGPASRSLIASIQSSRTSDIFGSSTQPVSHNDNVPQLKAKRDDVNMHRQSERIHSINTSLAASGHLFKTTISDGFGKLMYPNGTVYLGELENDTPHGHGKALYVGGASYEGDWNKGNREGLGKLSFSDGSYYEGTFLNKFHGDGKTMCTVTIIIARKNELTPFCLKANLYLPL